MSALGFEHALAFVVGGSVLGLADCGGGLETDGEVDGSAV